MNRRQFVTRVSTAAVGVCVVAKLPTTWLPEPIQRYAACEYLRKAWNEYVKGKGGMFPRVAVVGRELYDAFASEITATERFTPGESFKFESLAFKSAVVIPRGHGWTVNFYQNEMDPI